MPRLTVYRCKACGDALSLTYQDAAEHLVGCDLADPTMRRLARKWLEAAAARAEPQGEGDG